MSLKPSSALPVILLLAIGLPLAGALMVKSLRLNRAAREVRAIAAAIERFHRDTGAWPACAGPCGLGGRVVAVLAGPGAAPKGDAESRWLRGLTGSLDDHLRRNPFGYARWRGPYLDGDASADPWGNRYAVNLSHLAGRGESLAGGAALWVLSAGPDGIIESSALDDAASLPAGDDVGCRIR